jgi:hypothetical protein
MNRPPRDEAEARRLWREDMARGAADASSGKFDYGRAAGDYSAYKWGADSVKPALKPSTLPVVIEPKISRLGGTLGNKGFGSGLGRKF